MNSTRRNRYNKDRYNWRGTQRQHLYRGGGKLPKYASTMHGLKHWYENLIEKLGWMVIAKAKGNLSKISHYKQGIIYFLKTADHVRHEYEGANRKHDINVMCMHIEELQRFVNKHL